VNVEDFKPIAAATEEPPAKIANNHRDELPRLWWRAVHAAPSRRTSSGYGAAWPWPPRNLSRTRDARKLASGLPSARAMCSANAFNVGVIRKQIWHVLADFRAEWLRRLRNVIEASARKGPEAAKAIEITWGILQRVDAKFAVFCGDIATELASHRGTPQVHELLWGAPALPDETKAPKVAQRE